MESVRNPYIYRIYQLCSNICILTFIHSVCYSYIILLALADLSQCNKKSSGGGFHFYFTLSVKLFPVRLDLMMQKRPLAVFLEHNSKIIPTKNVIYFPHDDLSSKRSFQGLLRVVIRQFP